MRYEQRITYPQITTDSLRLREHLSVTPIDIKRIEGIVPTIIIK